MRLFLALPVATSSSMSIPRSMRTVSRDWPKSSIDPFLPGSVNLEKFMLIIELMLTNKMPRLYCAFVPD